MPGEVAAFCLHTTAVALVAHAASGNYRACSVVAALASSAIYLAYAIGVAGEQIKPGWAAPMLVVGFVLALPPSFAAGLPFLAWRRRRGIGRSGVRLGS